MKIFFSVGEPSGDLHAANLIRALRTRQPGVAITGLGGPRMAAAGAELLYPMTELAVMGIRRAVRHLPEFFRLADLAERHLRRHRPQALVLVDYPGFNLALAQRAKRIGTPVYYFVPPQIWAWRRGRVRLVRKCCSAVLTALPFEEKWYRSRGVNTYYVGHPYFDELARQQLDPAFLSSQSRCGGTIVGLLPGSRDQEVAANFEMMLNAARKIRTAHRDVRFLVAAFNSRQAEVARNFSARAGFEVEVHVGRTPEIIELSQVCVAVSGSVSLELMYRTKPSVIVYRMSPLALWLARRLVKLPSFTLVNLLAGQSIFPEIATSADESDQIARLVLEWLEDPRSRAAKVAVIAALRDRVVVPGACDRAADFLLRQLATTSAA
jgi:lipid-A-disaccharide synthase